MSELTDMRAKLTDQQRDIINAIWRYEREKNRGMPAVTLYEMFGSKEDVLAALEPLGGDVAYIPQYQVSHGFLTGFRWPAPGFRLVKKNSVYLPSVEPDHTARPGAQTPVLPDVAP